MVAYARRTRALRATYAGNAMVIGMCNAWALLPTAGLPADSLTGVGCDLRWWHSLAMAAAQFCVRLPLVCVVSLACLLKSYAVLAPAYAELTVPYARVHRTVHMPVGYAPYARLRGGDSCLRAAHSTKQNYKIAWTIQKLMLGNAELSQLALRKCLRPQGAPRKLAYAVANSMKNTN